MPYVIQCAVKRTAYESVFTCMDFNKVYWAVLPCILLLAVSAIIYFVFWNRDGTAAPDPTAVAKQPMAMSTMPAPILSTAPVIYGPPHALEYARYPQDMGPVMMTAQPPYQNAGIRLAPGVVPPPEPIMSAPMRPHMSGLQDMVNHGYVMEGGSNYAGSNYAGSNYSYNP